MGMFDSLFTNADAKNAATAKSAGLQSGFDVAKKFIDNGTAAYNQYADKASAKYDPLYSTGVAGVNAYGDALGLNGAEGSARSLDAFRSMNPGYANMVSEGLQAVDRGAASRGMLSSGNLVQAEQKYGSDLADRTWQQYVQNLLPGVNMAQNAAAGQAGILTGQGTVANNNAGKIADYGWKTETGIGDANASAELANGAAAQNMFNAITGGLNLAGKVIGMGF